MPTKFTSRRLQLHRELDLFREKYCGRTMLPPKQYDPNQPDIDQVQAEYERLVEEYRRTAP